MGGGCGVTSTFNTLQEQLYSYSTENNNNDCDNGLQMSSLLEPVLVVLDNLVDAVLTLLVQLCQTEVKGHQGGIFFHTFLDQSATCLYEGCV